MTTPVEIEMTPTKSPSKDNVEMIETSNNVSRENNYFQISLKKLIKELYSNKENWKVSCDQELVFKLIILLAWTYDVITDHLTTYSLSYGTEYYYYIKSEIDISNHNDDGYPYSCHLSPVYDNWNPEKAPTEFVCTKTVTEKDEEFGLASALFINWPIFFTVLTCKHKN